MAPTLAPAENVAYVTDIEGNMEYLLAYVAISDAFELASDRLEDGAADLVLRDGWRFVFGGDAVDKGGEVGGSIRVARTLVRLKRRYPDRVTILIGNRDANKMRITSELAPGELDSSVLESVPGPYWVPEAKRVSPMGYLSDVLGQSRCDAEPPSREELVAANTLANRIRWMLKETMGADGEFERRRKELAVLGVGRAVEDDPGYVEMPTDQEVCDSFMGCVREGGFMRELLQEGQMGVMIGPNLFLHGGVCGAGGANESSTGALGLVPGRPGCIPDVFAWVDALNAWYRDQVDDWLRAPEWAGGGPGAEGRRRGGQGLLDYVVPTGEPSVVLSRHLNSKGMPQPPPDAVARQLNACGIHRLVVGHTPHGNCPTVIKSGGPGEAESVLEIVMADTSYSDMRTEDNRGKAVSEVLLLRDGSARVHGRLPDEARLDYTLEPGVGPAEELVGQVQAGDGQGFVKAWLPDKHAFLFCSVDGFKYDYARHGPAHAAAMVLGPVGVQPPGRTRQRSFHACGDEVAVGAVLGETDNKMKLVEHLFKEMDSNCDGSICVEELRMALDQRGEFLKLLTGTGNAPWTADELLLRMDLDGSGAVSHREFRSFVLQHIAHSERPTPIMSPLGSPCPVRPPGAQPDFPMHPSSPQHRPPVSSPLVRPAECPLGISAHPAPLQSLPVLGFLAEPLEPEDYAAVAAALARSSRLANVAFLTSLATSGLAVDPSSVADAVAESEDPAADAAELRLLLMRAERPAAIGVLAAALDASATGGRGSLASRAAGGATGGATEARLDTEEARRLLGAAARERTRGALRLIVAQLHAEEVREAGRGKTGEGEGTANGEVGAGESARSGDPPPGEMVSRPPLSMALPSAPLSPLPSMESTVLLVHPPGMGAVAQWLSAALTGQPTGASGFAPPLHGGTAFPWRLQNRYYRARLSLLVVPDTPEANPRLRELAMQVGALLLLFDARAADCGWSGVVARWEGGLPGTETAPDVFLLLAEGGGADAAASDFALQQGAELVEIDCAEGSDDVRELAPLAAAARGEAQAVDTAGEWEGLARVLEAVQCRRWPEDNADPSPLPGAELTARLHAEAKADTRATVDRARQAGGAPSGRGAERDETAEAYMAALVGREPGYAAEAEDEAVERLIAQMSAIRENGAGLPDAVRRERAEKLALEMSRMFEDDDGSEDGSEADAR